MATKMGRFRVRLLATAALCAVIGGQSGARADASEEQGSSAPATSPHTATDTLAEVVVTAERRSQSLEQVPISATVLSADDLAAKGVTNLNAIQQVSPSIAINTYNRSTFINIRGIGIAQSAPTSNPGVAYYVDGQLIPHEFFIGQSFYDIESIEVLRGPQGTLSGQNSTGGAVYVRTPEPAFNRYSGYVDFTGADYNSYRAVAAINASTDQNFALRLAAIHDSTDGYTTNTARSDSQPGSSNMDAARLNLAYRSDDERLKINLRGDYFALFSDNNAVKNRTDLVTKDPFTIEEDGRDYLNQRGERIEPEVRYDVLEDVQARAMMSFQDGETHDQVDGDRTATALPRPPTTNLGRMTNSLTEIRTLISEFNLLSTGKGPFQWVVGAFTLDEKVKLHQYTDNLHTTDFFTQTPGAAPIILSAQNTTRSGFGQVNYYLLDELELIAGARYSVDEQLMTRFAVPGPPVVIPNITDENSHEITGKVGANYHLNDDLIYFTASKGYKAGGVNLTPGVPNFTPEVDYVYEVGFKSELLGRHLRINGDLFYSDYRTIQLQSLVNGLPTTQNGLNGTTKGGELEVTGQFSGLGFNAGVGYLDAVFANSGCVSDTNSPGTDAGCATNLRYVPQGRALPFSPRWSLNSGVQYAFQFQNDLMVTPRLQWSHLTHQEATPFPSINTNVPGRDIVDGRVTLDVNANYQVEVFAKNLFDTRYIASQLQDTSSSLGGIIYGPPRTVGVRLVARFGE